MVLFKNRDITANWLAWSKDLTAYDWRMRLNTTDAAFDDGVGAMQADPTSTLLTLGQYNDINGGNPYAYIAYCFHSVDGYSKVGSYTGNGSADGTFVYTGFSVAYVLIKRSNSSGQGAPIFDSARDEYNMTVRRLNSNAADSELKTDGNIDLLSNGFKVRNTDGSTST